MDNEYVVNVFYVCNDLYNKNHIMQVVLNIQLTRLTVNLLSIIVYCIQ